MELNFAEVNEDLLKKVIKLLNSTEIKEGILLLEEKINLRRLNSIEKMAEAFVMAIDKIPGEVNGFQIDDEVLQNVLEPEIIIVYEKLTDISKLIPDSNEYEDEKKKVEIVESIPVELLSMVVEDIPTEVKEVIPEKRKPGRPRKNIDEGPKIRKERTKKDYYEKPAATTRVVMLVCENPNIKMKEAYDILMKEGYVNIKEISVDYKINDTLKIIGYMRKIGKLVD